MTEGRDVLGADERTQLRGFLDAQREAVIAKVEGLTDAQAREQLVPSLTTPAGLLKHLVDVERWWMRVVFAGENDVPLSASRDDPDADWRIEADETVAELVERYREEVAHSNELLERAEDLDQLAQRTERSTGQHPTLRWIVLHLIEETARHAGHADILREQLDA